MSPTDLPTSRRIGLTALLAGLLLGTSGCARQEAPPGVVTREIIAKSGELDVPFVPTPENVVEAMFDMAKPTAEDFIIDLGSGDGRIVITAARDYGAQGFGVDLNEDLVRIANHRARQAGVSERARFYVRNIFETDIRQATVLTMYLLPDIVLQLRTKLYTSLRPGTRIVSHDFNLGEWGPDDVRSVVTGRMNQSDVYLWVVPADARGVWSWQTRRGSRDTEPHTYTAAIRQSYQKITGEARMGPAAAPLEDARLDGKRIRFSFVDASGTRQHFDGTIEDQRITGTVRLSGAGGEVTLPWKARRTGAAE